MTIREAIKYAVNELENSKIDEASLKAKILMEYCLNKDRAYIIAFSNEELSNEIHKKFISCIERAKKDEPIQYITGHTNFMGYNLLINKNVLIPRGDTEIVVIETFKIIERKVRQQKNKREYKILDMCTGSGAIIIAIARLCEELSKKYNIKFNFFAIDISQEAIELAKKNSIINDTNINFIKSNLFENISSDNKMDLIISNPPYIKTKDIEKLDANVKKEPIVALDGGKDGVEFYRKISKVARKFLSKDGSLVFEIGYDQKSIVESILIENNYKDIYVIKDLSLKDRGIICSS